MKKWSTIAGKILVGQAILIVIGVVTFFLSWFISNLGQVGPLFVILLVVSGVAYLIGDLAVFIYAEYKKGKE